MLPITWTTIRLFIHVLAATIWVGGQFTLAGLVPTLRGIGNDAPRIVARRFNRIAWPAFGVLIVTGIWNVVVVDPDIDSAYMRTLMIKIVVVALSGLSAFAHTQATSKKALAIGGAIAGLSALVALFLGVSLR